MASGNESPTNMTETLHNITTEERDAYLAYLQSRTIKTMIPAMILLSLISLLGVVGNSLVLVVYSRKVNRTSTRIFIVTIASFDLLSNTVVSPGEIYDMFHIWDFQLPHLCRARLFFSAFTTISAAIVLLGVAIVRYRKVCRPFGWQISVRQAKIMCSSIVAFSLLSSVPYGVINGRQTKPTPRDDVMGHECTTDDSFVGTIWPLVNTAYFLLLFLSCCIPLVVLYTLIGLQAWRHRKVYGQTSPPGVKPSATTSGTLGSQSQSDESANVPGTESSSASANANQSQASGSIVLDVNHQRHKESMPLNALSSGNGPERSSGRRVTTVENQNFETIDLDDTNNPKSGIPEMKKAGHVAIEETPVGDGIESRLQSHPKQHTSMTVPDIIVSNTAEQHTRDRESCSNAPQRSGSIFTKPYLLKVLSRKGRSKSKASRASKREGSMRRTSIMLFAITAVYILSLMPHLGCMFFKFLAPERYASMSMLELSFYNLFLRMYFLNSVANPIIYSLCDAKFRSQCLSLMSCARSKTFQIS